MEETLWQERDKTYNIYNIYIIKYILHFLPILHEAANFARGRLGISNCNCHCHRSFLKKGFQNKDANAYKSVRQRQELVHAKITSWFVQSYELAAWNLWVSKYKLPVNLYLPTISSAKPTTISPSKSSTTFRRKSTFPPFCSISPLITPHYLVVPNKSCNFAVAIPEMPLWQRK